MNKGELIGKLQMVYVGDTNALNELIGYYDGLKQGIEELQQENKKYKEVIDKAIEYTEEHRINNPYHYEYNCFMGNARASDLLDILKEVE